MMETNSEDVMLEQFFQSAREQTVTDDGFTQRVMERLPDTSAQRLSHLWTALCIVVAVVLFFVFRGWEPMVVVVLSLLKHPPSLLLIVELMGLATLGIFAAVVESLRRDSISLQIS